MAVWIWDLICAKDSISRVAPDGWRPPNIRILRRHQIMFAELRHGEFAGGIRIQVPWASVSTQLLLINLLLQRHERVNQRLRSRRTARDMHVHGNVAVDAFKHVVSLLERTTGDGTRAHGDDI